MTDLKCGPAMDEAVARALGWEYGFLPSRTDNWKKPDGLWSDPQPWSTDDACAVRDVLPEIGRREWLWDATNVMTDKICFNIITKRGDQFQCASPTLAEAICRAFLAACAKEPK